MPAALDSRCVDRFNHDSAFVPDVRSNSLIDRERSQLWSKPWEYFSTRRAWTNRILDHRSNPAVWSCCRI